MVYIGLMAPRRKKEPKIVRDTPLGRLMRRRRDELGLSARDVGDVAGITHTYVLNLEAGKNDLPSREVLTGLARALGVDEADLAAAAYWVASPLDDPSEPDGSVSLEEMVEVLERIRKLPSGETQEAALRSLPPRFVRGFEGLVDQMLGSTSGEEKESVEPSANP